jgi:hypothetical protein
MDQRLGGDEFDAKTRRHLEGLQRLGRRQGGRRRNHDMRRRGRLDFAGAITALGKQEGRKKQEE